MLPPYTVFLKKPSVNIDVGYFLGILNSKLMWYFLKNTGNVLRGGYFRFKTKFIEPFSIPVPPDSSTENDIRENVKSIIDLNRDFENKINMFISRIKTNFKLVTIPNLLYDFDQVTFEYFLRMLNDAHAKISIKDQDEWEQYFNSYKEEILSIKSKIQKVDAELNELVYKLYNISDQERRLIEECYPKSKNALDYN